MRYFATAAVLAALLAVSCSPKSPPPPADTTPQPEKNIPGAVGVKPEEAAQVVVPQTPPPPAEAVPAAPEPETQSPPETTASPDNKGEWVAKVGGQVITLNDYDRDITMRLAKITMASRRPFMPDAGFLKSSLDEMVDARVLRILATNEIQIPDDAVEREYQRGKGLIGSDERYKKYLERQRLDEQTLRAEIRDKLAVEEFRRLRTQGVEVSDEEVKTQYETMKGKGLMTRHEKTADLYHLVIFVKGDTPDMKEAARTAVFNAHKRITSGESFESVAREVSEAPNVQETGGLVQEASPQNVIPEVAALMFSMRPGELSEPINHKTSWHLMQVVNVNEPGEITYEKSQAKIRGLIRQERCNEILKRYIDQAKHVMTVETNEAALNPERYLPVREGEIKSDAAGGETTAAKQ